MKVSEIKPPFKSLKSRPIILKGVRQNNLKNVSVEFPAKKLSVVTGLSGSGKSSLVFDTLYAEGQRRYVESLSTYTRQFLAKMPKPELDSIQNIPPAIALEQRNHVLNSRSTVGTQTEVVDYMRLLYAKAGRTYCVDCQNEVKKLDSQTILNWGMEWLPGRKALIVAPIIANEPSVEKKGKKKPKAAKKKPTAPGTVFQILKEQGFARVLWKKSAKNFEVYELDDPASFPKIKPDSIQNEELFVVVDRLRINTKESSEKEIVETRSRILDSIDQSTAIGRGKVAFFDLDSEEFKLFDSRFSCIKCGREHRLPEPHLFSFNSPMGACPKCSGFGHTLELDEALVVPDPSQTLKNGALDPFSKPSFSDWQKALFRFAERQGISIGKRYRELTPSEKKLLWYGSETDDTFPGVVAVFEELKRYKYKLHIRVFIRRYQTQSVCPDCHG